MSEDRRVTVDEPLISTDVDRLIRIIAEKKRLRLDELRHLSGIDKRNVEKWLRVLEEEGHISIEYGITGTCVVWAGSHDAREMKESRRKEERIEVSERQQDAAYAEESASDYQVYSDEELYLSSLADEVQEAPVEEAAEIESPEDGAAAFEEAGKQSPEDLLDVYLSRKRKGGEDAVRDDLKSSILGNLDGDEQSGQPEEGSDGESAQYEGAEEQPSEGEGIRGELPEVEAEREIKREMPAQEKPVEPDDDDGAELSGKPQMAYRASGTGTRELIDAYREQINGEKAEIERLTKEREKLYREKLVGLESRMESDLTTLTEHVLERQSRIAELKESVLELPDRVGEVERLQEQMNALGREGREAVKRTSMLVDGYVKSLAETRQSLNGRLKEGRAAIDSEKDRVAELERLGASAESRVEKVRASMEAVKSQLAELDQGLKEMLAQLEEATEMKVEVSEMASQLKEELESRERDLDSLENDMGEISKIERWAMEYLDDYGKKMGEIEQYVMKGEEELAEVRKSAEAAYMKRYLKELDDMTETYDSELSQALAEEGDIEERMAKAKARLTSLVKESQSVVRKLNTSPAPDYEEARARAQGRLQKAKKTVQEKSVERQRLVEDVRKRRERKGRKRKK